MWCTLSTLYIVVNWTVIRLVLISPPGPNWLGMSIYSMSAVISVNVWRGLPFFAITVLAGLVSIPREYYEAAEVDGASRRGRFWYVTMPLLKPVLAGVTLSSPVFTCRDLHIPHALQSRRP